MTLRSFLIRGSLWAFGGRVLTGLSQIFLLAIVARLLDREQMAAFVLSTSVAGMLAVAARLGLDLVVLRRVSVFVGLGDRARVGQYVVGGILTALAAGFVTSLIYMAVAGPWLAATVPGFALLEGSALVTALWGFGLAMQVVIGESFRALSRIDGAVIHGGLSAQAILVLLLLPLYWGLGRADWITIIALAAGSCWLALGLGVISLFAPKSGIAIRGLPAISGRLVYDLIRESTPLFLSVLLIGISLQCDLWVVAWGLSSIDVALYGAAARTAMIIGLALVVVNAVLPPLIGGYLARGELPRIESLMRRVATTVAVPAMVVLVIVAFNAPRIMTSIFGPDYRDAATIFILLSLGHLVNIGSGACTLLLIMGGHGAQVLRVTAVAASLQVVVSIVAVQLYSTPEAVAVATVAAIVFRQTWMLFAARRRVGVWTHVTVMGLFRVVG